MARPAGAAILHYDLWLLRYYCSEGLRVFAHAECPSTQSLARTWRLEWTTSITYTKPRSSAAVASARSLLTSSCLIVLSCYADSKLPPSPTRTQFARHTCDRFQYRMCEVMRVWCQQFSRIPSSILIRSSGDVHRLAPLNATP